MSYKVVPHLEHADCLEVAIYRKDHPFDKEPISSITVECTKCGEVVEEVYNASEDNTSPLDDDPEREAVWARVEACFKDSDLDDEVHEQASAWAAYTNNEGLRAQFDYLYEKAGKDWLLELLAAKEMGRK